MRGLDARNGAIFMTIISSLMLGSSYVVIKLGVGAYDPFYLSAAAMLVGTIVCLIYMAWRGTLVRTMVKSWEFWAASLLNTSVVGCQYIGLTLTTASTGGLIIGTNVLFVAILSFFVLKEGLSPKRVMGLALGFIGLITITTKWDLGTLSGNEMVGDLFMLASAISIALVVILSPRALKKLSYDQWTLSLHMFLPITLLIIGSFIPDQGGFGPNALPIILFIGLVCTTVPTLLWTKALPKIGVVTSSSVLMLESTFAVVLSLLILREPLDAFIIVGALLTFIAIYFVADE
jgi:drug/metabolite transporter (DMT)-like permease